MDEKIAAGEKGWLCGEILKERERWLPSRVFSKSSFAAPPRACYTRGNVFMRYSRISGRLDGEIYAGGGRDVLGVLIHRRARVPLG